MKVYEDTKVEEPENAGEYIAQLRYSAEERTEFSRVIKEFNELYYKLVAQTWGNTKWRGVNVMKTPTDLWIYQELIHNIRPDLIIETGTCYGGSALYLRNLLNVIFPSGQVVSIDVSHEHLQQPAREIGIKYLLGSSVSDEILVQVKAYIAAYHCQRVMVILDSAHEKEHVLKELELYAPLVSVGSILIVEDTNTDGPFEALNEWRSHHPEFRQEYMAEKFLLTFNREGYFERVA